MYEGFRDENPCGKCRLTENEIVMNRMKSFGLLLTGVLVFLVVFSSSPAFAQTGTLEVTCEGPSGAPERDAQVTVMPITASKGNNKRCDAAGRAVFDKLNNGAYRVVARKNGFAPALYEFVVVNNDKASVTLRLTAGADSKFYFEDAAVERRANTLLAQGMKANEDGNPAEAEQFIAQALMIKPAAADILYNYGLSQERQGKFEEATESFRKAANSANLMLAAMPKPKPAAGAPKPGGPGGPGGGAPKPGGPGGPGGGAPKPGPQDRERMIYQLIVEDSERQIALMPVLKAEEAFGAKRFDEAVVLYNEAIKTNPQNPTLYSNMALAQAQAGRLNDALASVNKALEMHPGDERSGQVKKAIDALIENAEREKENAMRKQANDLLAEGNKLLESDAGAALKAFQEANAMTGEKQSVIWRQVGRARAKLKQDPEAVAAFQKAIELAAEDQVENYQMSLAQYYLDSKRPEEALDLVVAGSKNPEQRLMDLYTKGKNNPDSMAFSTAALERVVRLNPSNIEAVFELGQVYYMDRNDKPAREMLTRYIESGKDENRIQTAKDFLVLIERRNKD
jgi:tetratricopeptide (TPR) repeat protein